MSYWSFTPTNAAPWFFILGAPEPVVLPAAPPTHERSGMI